jgi:hypothetical protein
VKREVFEAQLLADVVDGFSEFGEFGQHRLDLGAVMLVAAMVEQAPRSRSGSGQRGDQRLAIFLFQVGTAAFQPFEAICPCDGALLCVSGAYVTRQTHNLIPSG